MNLRCDFRRHFCERRRPLLRVDLLHRCRDDYDRGRKSVGDFLVEVLVGQFI